MKLAKAGKTAEASTMLAKLAEKPGVGWYIIYKVQSLGHQKLRQK